MSAGLVLIAGVATIRHKRSTTMSSEVYMRIYNRWRY